MPGEVSSASPLLGATLASARSGSLSPPLADTIIVSMPTLSPARRRRGLRIALLYALFAGLWILFSDLAAGQIIHLVPHIQTYKGWLFVATTAVMLYFVWTWFERRQEQADMKVRQLNAELEQRVLDRTAALEATNRELEAFGYSVSHDLQAPIRAIDGFSQTLEEDAAPVLDDNARGHLARIRTAAKRMEQLIGDLLRLSRYTQAELIRSDVDLSAMAAAIAAELQQAEPQRKVQVIIEPGLRALGDARLLRVVLENLLRNAWKFTRHTPEPRIEVGQSGDDAGRRIFHVRDNGAGFDMARAQKLFTPFQRLHSAQEYEGTGIGLATVQRIVHRHSGRIWAEAKPGKGATFSFTLACQQETHR